MTRHLFELLIRAYPRSFRQRYGDELLAFLVEGHGAVRGRSMRARLMFWFDAVRDAMEATLLLRLGRAHRELHEGSGHWGGESKPGRVGRMSGEIRSDLRFAGRSFRRQPGFHALAMVTVALGVAATTAVFSVVDGVIRRPLPYPAPDRLVQVSLLMRHSPEGAGPLSHPDLLRIAERTRTMDVVAGVETRRRIRLGEGDARTVNVAVAAEGFLSVLGARLALGRLFAPEDHAAGAAAVVVLPYATWSAWYGRDPSIIGRTVRLDGVVHEVIGVLSNDFVAPEAVVSEIEYWTPLFLDVNAVGSFGSSAIGRLAAGTTVVMADLEVRGIIEEAYAGRGANFVMGAGVRDLRTATIGEIGSTLWVLLGAVALLLAIGCMNVANLMLVRAADRTSEVAIRTAMGATRGRIARQLVTESVLVALAGGALGAVIAYGLIAAFLVWGPGGIPRLAEVAIDGRALAFAFCVSALTGIAFGIVPALRAAHVAPASALVSGGRHSASGRVGRLRSGLVVAETAMALVLVLAAGLLVNSFVRMRTVDPGFEADGLVTAARIELRAGYETPSSWQAFWEAVLERTQAIPGVRFAAVTAFVPFLDFPLVQSYTPEGLDIPPDQSVFMPSVPVTPGFVRTLGLRIVEGRGFDGTEQPAPSEPIAANRHLRPPAVDRDEVVLVSEMVAHTYWPGEATVVGKRMKSGSLDTEDEGWYRVIGVVSDARHRLASEPAPVVYHPLAQLPWRQLSLLARIDGDAGPVLDAMREAVRSVDPGIPVRNLGTLDDLASESVVQPRFYSALAAGFGVLALALALIGVYGTAAYATARRAREIGIRIALGAEKRRVLAMLTIEAARLAAFGVLLGVPSALVAMRLLERHLFGVAPSDPATFVATSLAVAVTATLAAWLPARHASGLDPMTTLRNDA